MLLVSALLYQRRGWPSVLLRFITLSSSHPPCCLPCVCALRASLFSYEHCCMQWFPPQKHDLHPFPITRAPHMDRSQRYGRHSGSGNGARGVGIILKARAIVIFFHLKNTKSWYLATENWNYAFFKKRKKKRKIWIMYWTSVQNQRLYIFWCLVNNLLHSPLVKTITLEW